MEPLVADNRAVASLGLQHKTLISQDSEAPLVILVHGRAGNYSLMWAFRRTLPENINIIAVQAPLADPIGGWSWWQVSGHTKEMKLSEIDAAVTLLRDFIKGCKSYYNLKPSRTIALGFSQGAALLSRLILEDPNSLDSVALLAGFVLRPSNLNESAGLLSGKEIFIGHGTLDDTVPVDKALEGRALLELLGAKVSWASDEVGHKLGTTAMRALKEWSSAQLRNQIGGQPN